MAIYTLEHAIRELLEDCGDRLNFVSLDADDPANDVLLKKYGINPLPAVLYLNATNEVVAYTLGFSGTEKIKAGIAKILPSPPNLSSNR
ncbi:MAG TPA: hypothetical protein V6D08_01190 [Candidatus Obscuribacterales bacterium]